MPNINIWLKFCLVKIFPKMLKNNFFKFNTLITFVLLTSLKFILYLPAEIDEEIEKTSKHILPIFVP